MKIQTVKFNHNAITLLMNTAKEEYNNELSRTTTIDNKTNISLPIISAYFFTVAQSINLESFMDIQIKIFKDCLEPALLSFAYILSLVFSIIACIQMIRVIFFKPYQVIKAEDLYNNNFLSNDSSILSIELIRLYIQATSYNKVQNRLRIKLYRSGWIFTILSIFCFVIYIALK